MKLKKIPSFTLIEMLIVIVIIGILASALIPRLTSIQGRARDTKRKTDFSAIYNAQQIYHLDNGFYANSGVDIRSYNSPGTSWITGLIAIMGSVPIDPINNTTDHSLTGGYNYRYRNVVPGGSYYLTTQLENKQDVSRCELKNYYYSTTADPINGSVLCPIGSVPARRFMYVYDPINLKRH